MKKISFIVCALFINMCFVFGQEKEVNFDSNYIQQNSQQIHIEINEMQELMYIILALTDNGLQNKNIINHESSYYEEVMKYFSLYSTHPIVGKLNASLNESIVNIILLPGNAYGFQFVGNQIKPTGVYNFPAKGIGKFEVEKNPILTYLTDLEDFAEKSGFRKFYKEHEGYYNQLKKSYKDYATIREQKEWLEKRFDYTIDSYRVLTSPLIASVNATHMFEDNGFKEILLFLPTIKNDSTWTEAYKKAINTRIIFTEIDHNYVGPISAKNLDQINVSFVNREKWVDLENKGIPYYPNPLKVYDEYLTWGLYVLYAYDHFGKDEALFNQVIGELNEIMVSKRGFIKFKEFSAYLLQLYKKSEDKKIEKLYPALLEWGLKQ